MNEIEKDREVCLAKEIGVRAQDGRAVMQSTERDRMHKYIEKRFCESTYVALARRGEKR